MTQASLSRDALAEKPRRELLDISAACHLAIPVGPRDGGSAHQEGRKVRRQDRNPPYFLRREQFSNDIKNGAHIESVRNARNSRHLSIAIQSGVRLMRAPGKMLNARLSPPNNNAIWPHRAIWSVLMTFQRDRGQCIGHVKITDPTLVVRF